MPSNKLDRKQNQPSGIANKESLPEGFLTGLEAFAPVLSGLGALSNAAGGPKQLKELLAKVEPISVVIKDSVQEGGMHVVTAVFQNQTPQGIYLESLTLSHPADSELVVEEIVGYHGITHGSAPKLERAKLPYLLSSNEQRHYVFKLPLMTEKRFLKTPYAIASLIFSKLDEKSTAEKDLTFRLRMMS